MIEIKTIEDLRAYRELLMTLYNNIAFGEQGSEKAHKSKLKIDEVDELILSIELPEVKITNQNQ